MTTAELSRRTGASLRQLQWWTEHGWLRSSTSAFCRREFDWDELRIAHILTAMPACAGRRRMARHLRANPAILEQRYILLDAKKWTLLAASDHKSAVIRIAAASTSPVRLIDREGVGSKSF